MPPTLRDIAARGRGVTGLNLYSLFVSVVGASVVLFIAKRVMR